MAASLFALDHALVRICSESDDDHVRFGEKVWPFINAFCAFPGGAALFEKYGNYIARSTGEGTIYQSVWRAGMRELMRIMPNEPADPKLRLICPVRFLRVRPRQVGDIGSMADIRRAITRVLDEYRLSDQVRSILRTWWDEANAIESYGLNHLADACRYFYRMQTEGLDSNEAIILRSSWGGFYHAEIRSAARFLVQELKASLALAPAASVDVDDLLGIEELAFLCLVSPKTLRNKKVLPDPEQRGGGRKRKNLWRYSTVKPTLEASLRITLPSCADAHQALVQFHKLSN